MHPNLLRYLLIPMVFCGVTQCAKDGLSSKIKVSVDPGIPIVILADYEADPDPTEEGDEITYKAPWFVAYYTIENQSDKTITIQSLLFNYSIRTTKGSIAKTTGDFGPDDIEPPLDPPLLVLTELDPGESDTIGVVSHGLTKDVKSYNYSVNVKLQGWVGSETDPEDKLYKEFTFSTK